MRYEELEAHLLHLDGPGRAHLPAVPHRREPARLLPRSARGRSSIIELSTTRSTWRTRSKKASPTYCAGTSNTSTAGRACEIISTGGGAASPFWNQLKADVCGMQVLVPTNGKRPVAAPLRLLWSRRGPRCPQRRRPPQPAPGREIPPPLVDRARRAIRQLRDLSSPDCTPPTEGETTMKLAVSSPMIPGGLAHREGRTLKRWGYDALAVFQPLEDWSDGLRRNSVAREADRRPARRVRPDRRQLRPRHVTRTTELRNRAAARCTSHAASVCAELGTVTEIEYQYGARRTRCRCSTRSSSSTPGPEGPVHRFYRRDPRRWSRGHDPPGAPRTDQPLRVPLPQPRADNLRDHRRGRRTRMPGSSPTPSTCRSRRPGEGADRAATASRTFTSETAIASCPVTAASTGTSSSTR